MKFLTIFVLFAVIVFSYALSCPPECDPSTCDIDLTKCKFGTVWSVCGCCKICAQGPGESCGGLWGMQGFCAEGLKCVDDDPQEVEGGTCVAQ